MRLPKESISKDISLFDVDHCHCVSFKVLRVLKFLGGNFDLESKKKSRRAGSDEYRGRYTCTNWCFT